MDIATLASLALVGAAVLALAILVLRALAWRAMRRHGRAHGIEAVGIGSRYRRRFELTDPPETVRPRARAALDALPQGLRREQPGEGVGAVTLESERSFGERVGIEIERTTAGRSRLTVTSRPIRFQLFDGGINAENVARIVAALGGRGAAGVATPEPAPASALWDAVAYAVLALVAAWTGTLIGTWELSPPSFAAIEAWLDRRLFAPLASWGLACPAPEAAAGQAVMRLIGPLAAPLAIVYGFHNGADFAAGRERMDAIAWILAIASPVFLPALLALGCGGAGAVDWLAASGSAGLIALLLDTSYGGIAYALGLLSFANGVSYWLALPVAWLLRR